MRFGQLRIIPRELLSALHETEMILSIMKKRAKRGNWRIRNKTFLSNYKITISDAIRQILKEKGGSPKTAYEVINTMEKKYNNSLFASSTVRAILSQIATGQKKLDGAVHYALKD